jgi:predicted flap endonuclease-1-like 5' DNA nuclease
MAPSKEQAEDDQIPPKTAFDDELPLRERLRALLAMVAHGVDEHTVTLTIVNGIGGKLARRLQGVGISDIEELALSDTQDFENLRGISAARAARWIEEATEKIRTQSAFSLRDSGPKIASYFATWTSSIDPYRLRRALDLKVQQHGDGFAVSGGLEPHRVTRRGERLSCDCGDFTKRYSCKHVLAVGLYNKDSDLLPLVERIASSRRAGELDLFHLWFDGGKK